MESLKNIVSRVLNVGIGKINGKLSRNDTEEWDSFNHLLLISEIEKNLGIKFTASEIDSIKTFKDLSEMVLSKESKNK